MRQTRLLFLLIILFVFVPAQTNEINNFFNYSYNLLEKSPKKIFYFSTSFLIFIVQYIWNKTNKNCPVIKDEDSKLTSSKRIWKSRRSFNLQELAKHNRLSRSNTI